MSARNRQYPDKVREDAFWLWFLEADRDNTRTARLLRETEDRLAQLDGRDPDRTPDSDTIRYWVLSHNWNARAHEEIAQNDEVWYHRQLGRLKVMHDRVITEAFAIVAGERNNEPAAVLNAKVAIYKHNTETLGIGTFSHQTARPEIPYTGSRNLHARLADGRTPMELAAENAERCRAMEREEALQRALNERDIPEAGTTER